jgi:hypothetical protein
VFACHCWRGHFKNHEIMDSRLQTSDYEVIKVEDKAFT